MQETTQERDLYEEASNYVEEWKKKRKQDATRVKETYKRRRAMATTTV